MSCQITVVMGNIVQQPDCDAIVNSANPNLRAGSGVCGAIYRAAGPDLEPCSTQFAPLGLGEAIVTPGFNLPNRLIVHVRGPKYLFDPAPASNLAKAMQSIVSLAEQEEIRKIAVPAISMGVYQYPHEEAVRILVATAKAMAFETKCVEEIRFVVLDRDLYALFQKSLASTAH